MGIAANVSAKKSDVPNMKGTYYTLDPPEIYEVKLMVEDPAAMGRKYLEKIAAAYNVDVSDVLDGAIEAALGIQSTGKAFTPVFLVDFWKAVCSICPTLYLDGKDLPNRIYLHEDAWSGL